MITGYGTVKKAVEAIKNGAYDFIEKPVDHLHPFLAAFGDYSGRGLAVNDLLDSVIIQMLKEGPHWDLFLMGAFFWGQAVEPGYHRRDAEDAEEKGAIGVCPRFPSALQKRRTMAITRAPLFGTINEQTDKGDTCSPCKGPVK